MVQLLKDGAVTQEYAYDAYGYINADEFGIQAPFYGYNGEKQNPFTGLQYLRARYYAPQNGGFITQDSFSGVLDDALTQNRYTYAGNNPLNNIDPSGHRYVKGIEIGDNLKSSSAKKQPTTSGRPLSPGLTGAVVKKTTTNKKAPAISGSIAANAALSAARAGVPVGASSAVVNAIRQEPYISVQNASGQTVTVPSHFSNIAEAAKNFIRRMCDAEMQRIETQRAVEQAQQKILSDTVHSAGNAISAFYKAWNANANYWHDYYNNATNVGDFLYGGVNYFTYGLIDGINKSYQQRHQEMLDDFTLYNIANWGLSGIPDRVKGAIAPEDPLSLQHWLDSFSVVMIGYGLYQGYQFANAPANTINTAHPVTGTGMLDDFASNSTNTIWDSVVATADDIPGTNVPATFQINLADDLAYINPKTGSNTLWTNANATEHMGEYIARLDNGLSVGVRSQTILSSYGAAVNQAMNELINVPVGRHFGIYGNWELGINTQTGVVYHAQMIG